MWKNVDRYELNFQISVMIIDGNVQNADKRHERLRVECHGKEREQVGVLEGWHKGCDPLANIATECS